jgi:hypothetical protein
MVGSSQSGVLEVEPVASKPVITCFNCSKPGHYQSNYLAPPHYALCDIDGHTTGMCPYASKPPALKWYGISIYGKGFYAMDNVAPLPRIQPENLAYVLVDDPRADTSQTYL